MGGALIGVVAGCSSALFLYLLERITSQRVAHGALVWLLPIAGLVLGFGYERWGASVARGTSLVIDRARSADTATPAVPCRMAPMVLAGTLMTHLFGGSAGREGTAVQLSGSLVDGWLVRLGLDGATRRDLVAASIAGGFGSVFGTPIAGAIFGVEVLVLGRRTAPPERARLGWLRPTALLPAVIASLVGDRVTRALGDVVGVEHSAYPVLAQVPLSIGLVWKWAVLAAASALVVVVFVEAVERLKHLAARFGVRLPLRMFIGGAIVVALYAIVGRDDYLGLGVPTILRAFSDPTLEPWAFALKLLFTVVTLGAGFIGGEVTPLFFVGATLGSTLGGALGLPIALGATVGLAATFGAAANTPLALSIMAMELVGAAAFPHVFVVTFAAWALTGRRTIYPSAPERSPETRAAAPPPGDT